MQELTNYAHKKGNILSGDGDTIDQITSAKVASPKNIDEPYDDDGECKRFQPKDGSYTQSLHYVEDCKRKKTNEESHVKTKKEEDDPEKFSLALSLRRIRIEVLN